MATGRAARWIAAGVGTTAVLVGAWLWQRPGVIVPSAGDPAHDGATAAPGAEPGLVIVARPATAEPAQQQSASSAGTASTQHQRSPEASARFPSERFEPEAYSMGRMQIFGGFWRRAEQEWNASRFREAEENEALLNGRQSYQVYVYLRTCLDAPRSPGHAANVLEQIETAVGQNPRLQDPERVDQMLGRLDAGLARCEGLPEELEPVTLAWLTRAATRGYPLAQIAYYRSYRWLAARKPYLLFGEYDGVRRYRQLAPHLVQAALGSGHPEALVEMGTALADGLVFERDPVEAYAYALAADEAGRPDVTVGADLRATLDPELDDDQRNQARLRARELCEQYCL